MKGILILILSAAPAAFSAGPAPASNPAMAQQPAAPQPPSLAGSISKAVKDYVAARIDLEDATFHVWDEDEDGAWELTLKKVRPDTLRSLGHGRYSLCADFSQKAEQAGEPDVDVDVDFIAMHGDKGWVFEEVLIHKVDGRSRFTYDEKNQRVPVRHSEEEEDGREIDL